MALILLVSCNSTAQDPQQSTVPPCPGGPRLANGTCPDDPNANTGSSPTAATASGASPDGSTLPTVGGTLTGDATDNPLSASTDASGGSGTQSATATAPSVGPLPVTSFTSDTGTGTSTSTGAVPVTSTGSASGLASSTAVYGATGTAGPAFVGVSPALSTSPVTFATASATGTDPSSVTAPSVKLVAAIAGAKLLAYVAFASTDGVGDVNFQYGRDHYPVNGTTNANGEFVATEVALPVQLTFTYNGRPCRVITSADFVERQYSPKCD